MWLKTHNYLYKDIEIDEGVLQQLDSGPILPFHVEHITPSQATENSTAGYNPLASNTHLSGQDSENTGPSISSMIDLNPVNSTSIAEEIPFASMVITDVENTVSSSQLAAAAIHHLHKKMVLISRFLMVHNLQMNFQFKQHLTSFLDDTISNCVPPDTTDLNLSPYHLCSVHKPPIPAEDSNPNKYILRDRHLLVQCCQYHRHSAMCYKYDIHSCQFDMHEGNYRPISCFDSQTGELTL